MRLLTLTACCAAAAWLVVTPAYGAHTQARLLLSAKSVKPGETLTAGVQMNMDPGWHTYWKNSGASGAPTTIEWSLPPGIRAGDLRWPIPERLPEEDLTTYIYHDEVVLCVTLTVGSDVKPGTQEIKAKVAWLECEQLCVPGEATVSAKFEVGNATQPSSSANILAAWEKRLPSPDPRRLDLQAAWMSPAEGNPRPVMLEWKTDAKNAEAEFFPYASDAFEVQPKVERLPAGAGKARIRVTVKKISEWPAQLSGVLVEKNGKERAGWEVKVPISARSKAGGAVPGSGQGDSVGLMLLYAFAGGLILNIMPCVLPVIALKILGFVTQARENPKRVRQLGFIYGAGVWVSFLALAGLVLGVKAAGHHAGWGMQFGNPQFLVALTILVTLVALNLFGLFEVSPGGRIMDVAGGLASKHGAAGAFFNGVLATVLATPCTAPFLGAALGFAFTQSSAMIVLIFSVVAAGLAAPYVVLSWNPAWLKFVPKPGAWMERFKIAMGFPMLATAIWLFSLIPLHYGSRSWWLPFFLVIVAFAAWIYGEFFQRVRRHRAVALIAVLLLLFGGFAYAIEGQLDWRKPLAEGATQGQIARTGLIQWERWSPEAVAKARAEGRPVLVDFTADWCITCQANKKFAIEIPRVEAKLKEINAVALLGDYTRLPEEITAELARFGRAGVPLVLVYPRNPSTAPQVLPATLTPGIMLDALAKAIE